MSCFVSLKRYLLMSYFEESSSTFFSCALTVNVIRSSFLGEITSDEIAHMLFCRYVWALMLFCFTIFVRDISGWDVMFFFGGGGVTTSFACESWCLFGRCSMSWWNDTLFGCRVFLLMVERYVLKEAGDWVYTMVYWTLCGVLCVQVGWFVGGGNECTFIG